MVQSSKIKSILLQVNGEFFKNISSKSQPGASPSKSYHKSYQLPIKPKTCMYLSRAL